VPNSSEIVCETKAGVGIITLNAERTLNALTLQMFKELQTAFETWAKDESVRCIFLRGAGDKAFCAGGDVKQMAKEIISLNKQAPNTVTPDSQPQSFVVDYFKHEYKCDYTIHKYEKPIIVWADGIVMGGGVGLASGASHRIVTERSKFAMPEIAIGLYPDVGGTWFLNKMPGSFGIIAGMTGLRMNAADCLYLGLADFYISSELQQTALDALIDSKWSDDDEANFDKVDSVLSKFDSSEDLEMSPTEAHVDWASKFDDVQTASRFREILMSHAQVDDWINAAFRNFESGSPSSAHVIFEQLQRGKTYSLEQVFESELNLSVRATMHPDFAEGVRALLIEKDNKPKWSPASFEEVTKEWVESYFVQLDATKPAGWLSP
jgi:enoyl-CoA hydratase/carnithine racemase